jgi:hypothetical protein
MVGWRIDATPHATFDLNQVHDWIAIVQVQAWSCRRGVLQKGSPLLGGGEFSFHRL